MALSKAKVKVDTAKLLEAVKSRRAKITSDHEKALTKYMSDLDKYATAVQAAVDKAVVEIKKGNLPEAGSRYSWGACIKIPVKVSAPSEPQLDTKTLDRMIATLEMAADDTLVITSDDFALYLG